MNALSKAAKAAKEAVLGKPAPAPESATAPAPETPTGETPTTGTAAEPEVREGEDEGTTQGGQEGAQEDAGATDQAQGEEGLVKCEVLAFDGLDIGRGRHARAGEVVHLPPDFVAQYAAVGQLKILE